MEDDINGNINSFHLFEMKDGELIQNDSPSMPTLRTDPAMAPAPGGGGPGQWRWNRLLHRCQAGAIWDIFWVFTGWPITILMHYLYTIDIYIYMYIYIYSYMHTYTYCMYNIYMCVCFCAYYISIWIVYLFAPDLIQSTFLYRYAYDLYGNSYIEILLTVHFW